MAADDNISLDQVINDLNGPDDSGSRGPATNNSLTGLITSLGGAGGNILGALNKKPKPTKTPAWLPIVIIGGVLLLVVALVVKR
jgi:hypothetical protein